MKSRTKLRFDSFNLIHAVGVSKTSSLIPHPSSLAFMLCLFLHTDDRFFVERLL
jgi:hypothetical protein